MPEPAHVQRPTAPTRPPSPSALTHLIDATDGTLQDLINREIHGNLAAVDVQLLNHPRLLPRRITALKQLLADIERQLDARAPQEHTRTWRRKTLAYRRRVLTYHDDALNRQPELDRALEAEARHQAGDAALHRLKASHWHHFAQLCLTVNTEEAASQRLKADQQQHFAQLLIEEYQRAGITMPDHIRRKAAAPGEALAA